MNREQYKKAEELEKLINNHKGILVLLTDAVNVPGQLEIKIKGQTYRVPERLVHEFVHATNRSLDKLEEEFEQL